MTTPADQPLDDALRRADVGWLSRRLDARLCPPAVFGRLIRHEDPRLRYLGLVLLDERVTSGRTGDAAETAELARLLPMTLEGSPEALLVLARLHQRLGPYVPGSRRPSWRTAELPVRVRIAWLRAELTNEPTVIRQEPRGELLYQAVREATVTCAHRPAQLVDELVDSGDPVLRAEALRLAREGLHAGLLAPALVRGHVIRLLGTGDGDGDGGSVGADRGGVVAAALAALRERTPPEPTRPPSRQDLLTLARTGDPARIHQALTRLTEAHTGPAADRDPDLRDLIDVLLHHPKPGIRLHAHRASRALLDRGTYLHHTSILLADPQPDLVRTAIRTLTHTVWPPAIPAMTALVEHPHPTVRTTATEALITLGTRAVPALTHAASHTRPDKRPLYEHLLHHITTTDSA
ncbi:HEAT repeat domain-containing protein [Streptomyces sp. NPDC005533]|uniref:HEAT repeat domain-containing protein n=1 Tax=Streptomyces sp. NPDC005533 TaxID=3364723 RepID=UPI0036977A42